MRKVPRFRWTHISAVLIGLSLAVASVQPPVEAQGTSSAASVHNGPAQIHALKVTLLSTMLVGSTTGLGEWGFSALIEADGHRVLLDTGAHPDTVLQNARDLKIDLSDVREVILTHNHSHALSKSKGTGNPRTANPIFGFAERRTPVGD